MVLEVLMIAAERLLISWMVGLAFSRAVLVSLITDAASCLAGVRISAGFHFS